MISAYQESFKPQIYELLRADSLQNPYLYIDVYTYGLSGKNSNTYLICQDKQIKVIIYQYYNSFQLFINQAQLLTTEMLADLQHFIMLKKPVMVSGLTSLMKNISAHLPAYRQTDGYLFKYEESPKRSWTPSFDFRWAHTTQEFERLAAFITSDSDIGSHYTIPQLTQQLIERHQKYGCQNVFLEKQGSIVAHGGTYGCYGELAVIGGLLIDPAYRGKGLGKQLMTFLSGKCVAHFHQQPVLYCYNPTLFKFYNMCGYQPIYNCSKLELLGENYD